MRRWYKWIILFVVLLGVGIAFAQSGPPDLTVRNLVIKGTCQGCLTNGIAPSTNPTPVGPTSAPTATPWPSRIDTGIVPVTFHAPADWHDPIIPSTTFDEVNGTATTVAGSANFTLVTGSMNVSNCGNGNYWISISGAMGHNLIGRQRAGLTTLRPLPLTGKITACSDSTHGTVDTAALVSVNGTGANCSGLDTSVSMDVNTRFPDGCVRLGTDVSGLINSNITGSNQVITLPSNANGFVSGAVNIKFSNVDLEGGFTRLWSGWEGGITPAQYYGAPGFYGNSCNPGSFTGSIGGASHNVLTVSSITNTIPVPACGPPLASQCSGAGAVGNSNQFTLADYPFTTSPTISPGTLISCQLTGTPCGVGTYTISAQTGNVGNEPMEADTNSCQGGHNGVNIVGTHPTLDTNGNVTVAKARLSGDIVNQLVLDGGLDFNFFDFPGAATVDANNPVPVQFISGNWNAGFVSASVVAGVNAGYVSGLIVENNKIWNYVREIGVIEDYDNVTIQGNTHWDCHEDCEHIGESYLPQDTSGDSNPALNILTNTLWGYSDDGIALVGGDVPCTTAAQGGPGGPVQHSRIVGNSISGSHNPGGSWIYNGAIQIAGNVSDTSLVANGVTAPAAESVQIVDYFGGSPRNTLVGSQPPILNGLQAGCMPAANCNNANFVSAGSIDLGGPAVQIAGEAGPSDPFFQGSPKNLVYPCPVTPVSNTQVSGNNMTMPLLSAVTVHRGNSAGSSYKYGSVAGACVSAFGFVTALNANLNTCNATAGSSNLAGLWLDPDWMPSTITNQITWASNTLTNFGSSSSTINCYGASPPAACSITNTTNYNPGISTSFLPPAFGGWTSVNGVIVNTGQVSDGNGNFYIANPTSNGNGAPGTGRDFGWYRLGNTPPIIYSYELGNIYVYPSTQYGFNLGYGNLLYWDYGLQHWFATSMQAFPWLYDGTLNGQWLFYYNGTNRWFYNNTTGQYIFSPRG